MLEALYSWLRSLAYFMVFSTILLHMIPGQNYQKYIRFFTGLLLVILLIAPVMEFFSGNGIEEILDGSAYQQSLKQLEEAVSYMGQLENSQDLPGMEELTDSQGSQEETGDRIQVEEIRIGQ